MKKLVLSLAVSLVAVGCVYPSERGRMLESRVAQLEADKAAMDASLLAQREMMEAQLPAIRETLARLEELSRKSSASTGVQVDELQAVISSLRGRLEEQTFRIDQMGTAMGELKSKNDEQAEQIALQQKALEEAAQHRARAQVQGETDPQARTQLSATTGDLPQNGRSKEASSSETSSKRGNTGGEPVKEVLEKGTPAYAAAVAAQNAADKAKADKASSDKSGVKKEKDGDAEAPVNKADAKAFADAAVAKLKADPVAGRKMADEFLRKWPKHVQSGRVHYEVGMSWFGEKNYRAALAEFGVFVQPDTPKALTDSKWAPDALLRSADCFAALKMEREATMALEEVVNGYPRSSAAKTARSRLESQSKKNKAVPKASKGKKKK